MNDLPNCLVNSHPRIYADIVLYSLVFTYVAHPIYAR